MIENAQFSEYYFYINLNIQADFQICISVPLNNLVIAIAKKLKNLRARFEII